MTKQDISPCDWDQESYCTIPGCKIPATHQVLDAMVGNTPIYELVCCAHAQATIDKPRSLRQRVSLVVLKLLGAIQKDTFGSKK